MPNCGVRYRKIRCSKRAASAKHMRNVGGRPCFMRDISLSQLRYFLMAAEHGSMTEAAGALFIAQSAVSSAVARLEDSLGTQLFIRQRAKGLVLTADGLEFL